VKLLFDANLSRKIVRLLEDLFPGSSQVMLLGLPGETADATIWQIARERGFTIVSADADFMRLSEQFGAPPKVIRLERMDYSTQTAASVIRRNSLLIYEFEQSSRTVLLLRKSS
jgi:predicted nuclease of predicted toxin-antitoxin system